MVYIGGDREGEPGPLTLDQWALPLSMILETLQSPYFIPQSREKAAG